MRMESAEFKKFISTIFYLSILFLVFISSSGCQRPGEPRLRAGAFFGSPVGMRFTKPENLGKHSFEFTLNETNGMMYTRKGGFIDIGHVREAADRTAYLRRVTYQNIIRDSRTFSFHVIEPSKYWVTLSYPKNWDDYSIQEKQAIASEVSIELGQYLAHTSLIWHEILTWYGFSSSGIFPDNISAFSWEDTYSDMLGIRLAAQALRDDPQQYDKAMTQLLYQALQELGVQPAHVARQAAKKIENQWYSGGFYFFVNMKRRNYDVGMDDNYITPWLVPGICPDAEPLSIPVSSLESLYKYGFDFNVEIEPKVLEKNRIYHSIDLAKNSRLKPQVDFPRLMEYIQKRENKIVTSVAAK